MDAARYRALMFEVGPRFVDICSNVAMTEDLLIWFFVVDNT